MTGAATPLAAAAVVGTMAVAAGRCTSRTASSSPAEGWEYVMNLATASVALAGLGSGPLSVDRAVWLDGRLRKAGSAALAAGLGLAAAAVQLGVFWRHLAPPAGQ